MVMKDIVKVELDKNISENRDWLISVVKNTINSLNFTINTFFKVEMKEVVVKIDKSKEK